jgi:carbamoyl-phosphate synthase large subunit
VDDDELAGRVGVATPERIFEVGEALRRGWGVERVAELTAIDPWFLDEMSTIYEERPRRCRAASPHR